MISTPVLRRVRPAHRLFLLVGLLVLVLTQLVLSLTGRSATVAEAAVAPVATNSDDMADNVPSGAKVVTASFNTQKVGRETPKAFIKELGVETNRSTSQYDDMTIIKSGAGKALRTRLDKGTIRDNPGGNHGAVLVAKLPRSYDKACITYRVRFSSDFDWSLGGKLPGLLGVAPGTSPSTPTGGGSVENGWSGRVMWLGPKAYSWAGPNNMGVTYLYHPGQADKWGDNVRWNKPFVAGQWHTIQMCYAMNTVGSANGKLAVWFDGTQVRNDTNVVYRKNSNGAHHPPRLEHLPRRRRPRLGRQDHQHHRHGQPDRLRLGLGMPWFSPEGWRGLRPLPCHGQTVGSVQISGHRARRMPTVTEGCHGPGW